jgi:hypothetical protein
VKSELKYAFLILSLGAGLVAYAHSNFVTKYEVDTIKSILYEIRESIKIIDQRLYEFSKDKSRNGGNVR